VGKKIELIVLRGIVAFISMSEGVPNNTEASMESKKTLSYSEAVKRYEALKDSVQEAEKIEGIKDTEEGRVIAKLDLQIDACNGQAEAYAQQGDPYAERAMRMLAQFREAEKTIVSLYFDAKNDSPEFAEILESEHPWLRSVKGGDVEDYGVDA
jgi:hypothetical protein